MECILSNEKRQARRRSKEIDRMILRDTEKRARNIDILLTGTKNAGKNTLLKQIDLFVTHENKNEEESEDRKIEQKRNIQKNITGIVEDIHRGNELKFNFEVFSYNILNVGNLEETTLRRKWMHYFEHLNGCIIFVVALDCYDMTSYDDGCTNQMRQSLELFNSYVNSVWCADIEPIILVFNKNDLFEKKILKTPLTVCFPEYSGSEGKYEEAYDYILMKFLEVNSNTDRTIYCHKMCALDSYECENFFHYMRDCIHQIRCTVLLC